MAASEPTIVVEGVSKRYERGIKGAGGLERLEGHLRSPLRRLRGKPAEERAETSEEFWALRDVSLEVQEGEVLGLIGANGAGKSTLLKLLSRITAPTDGRITLHGRVGSLLEVGTGFHPELTGRENIFLNGAIIGMGRREIGEKFAQIVEFSGVSDFLDTPVKRYSSGMYVRLAFAVAAHLESEILLVDEVLSVGDAEFQKKSLGKMDDVASAGRTVVFVSHNLSAVQRLCQRSIWIDKGRIAAEGSTQAVMVEYLKQAGTRQEGGEAVIGDKMMDRVGTGKARVRRMALVNADGEVTDQLRVGEPFSVRLTVEVMEQVEDTVVELGLASADGTRVVTVQNIDFDRPTVTLDPGMHEIVARMDASLLPGDFTIDAMIHHRVGLTHDVVEGGLALTAVNVPHRGEDIYPWNVVRGAIRVPSEWGFSPVEAGQVSRAAN